MIRKATQDDLPKVAALYEKALDYEDKTEKYTSWQRGIYPTAATARLGLKTDSLYVYCHDGEILASVILDQKQPPEYKSIFWGIEANSREVLVIHTLCVDPEATGKGVGTQIIDFVKELAKSKNCKTIRLNTTGKNRPALHFYQKNGFAIASKKEILLNGQIKCNSHLFLFYNL